MQDLNKKENQDLYFFNASGYSMWPFLKDGEKVIVKEIPIEQLRVGDIILYRADNKSVCHRLVNKIKDAGRYMLYVRGDNSLSAPQIIAEDMYKGKVVAVISNGKFIDLVTKSQNVLNFIVVKIAPLISWANKMVKPLYKRHRK